MEDMWRYRDKPVPLDFDLIQSDQFVLRGQVISAVNAPADGVLRPVNGDSGVEGDVNGSVTSRNGSSATPTSKARAGKPGHGLKDQRSLSLRENLTLFISRLVSTLPFDCALMLSIQSSERLAVRLRAGEETILFDKDDDDTLDFVTAAANLRSGAYGIPGKSRWEVKGARAARPLSWQVHRHIMSRNGREHHTCNCNNQCNYFGFDCAAGPTPVACGVWFLAKRSCTIQALRPSELH
jgi:ubiquitin-like 1-activating enzyme E1 B